MSTSADALLALNALLSASNGGIPANEASSSSSVGSADNLTNLLDTLANFSAQVNTFPSGGDGGHGDGCAGDSNIDVASLLMAGLASAKNEPEPVTDNDYERYEREREQKFRELEAKFSFLNPKKPKVDQNEPQRVPSGVGSSAPPVRTDTATMAAAGKAFATSAMAELLSGFQKSRMQKNTTTSAAAQKPPPRKRRTRSPLSSGSSSDTSSESSSSGSDSGRSGKAKKKKGDRKKKAKRVKTKKEKQKNGKSSSAAKLTKVKKDLLEAERKAVSDRVSKLKADLADYEKRRRLLEEELSRLKKQHNEMCRKLQRQKSDPRKDTLIIENEALQADIEKHLKNGEKQRENDEKALTSEEKHLEKLKKQAKAVKKDEASSKKAAPAPEVASPAKKPKEENIEYFDPGSHWCQHCNVVSANVFEWLEHLHSQKHKSNMDALDRPWMPDVKAPVKKESVAALKPFKGAEFLMPSTAFFCNLCKEFSGDSMSAEAHLKSASHNTKYQAYLGANPFYERREMLEKAAAASHRLEKSVSGTDDKKSHHRSSADNSGKGQPRAPEPQRVPHKPNESGKIKPFHLSTSSSSADKGDKRTSSGFSMKLKDPKTSVTPSSSSTLKKPHSAFSEGNERLKRESSGRYSDNKRHRDR